MSQAKLVCWCAPSGCQDILLPSKSAMAKIVPHGPRDCETVVIESSFIMSPIRVVIPTANEACTRMRSGIRIPDFPSRNKRYITHVNEPTDQSTRSAGYAGESMSSFSVVYWSRPTSATNQTSDAPRMSEISRSISTLPLVLRLALVAYSFLLLLSSTFSAFNVGKI